MSEITKDTFKKPTPNPLLAGLPAHLKDPANYDKVRKVLIETLAGSCSHGEVIEWAACRKCQERFAKKSHVLKKLGFKSPAQYMMWQRVHEQMKTLERVAFKKYDE